ncbi:MAG TPA: hypothetical protein DEQ14_11105 [Treponema sp.]|nr:hypothetical protein [Treponema sp.]
MLLSLIMKYKIAIADNDFPHSKRNAKITLIQQTKESPVPTPYSPNKGIDAARDSGRRRKGGHDKCFYAREKVRKVSPLFLYLDFSIF